MSKAPEARTTGGNTNIDYNLRLGLGFPDGNITINQDNKVELIDDSLLALLIEGLGLFVAKTYGSSVPDDLQAIIDKLAAWYHY